MRKERISQVIGELDSSYLSEAMEYTGKKKRHGIHNPWGKMLLAAALCICIVVVFWPNDTKKHSKVMAYTYGSYQEIKEVGTILATGQVNADGSMTGAPLRFFLRGPEMKSVRFSVKNEALDFHDWTEKREEYGVAKNFTVEYGKELEEYDKLVLNWEPDQLWKALEENKKVSELPQELREDLIVLEIKLADGTTETKAIKINLQEDGNIKASFEEYKLTDKDAFVKGDDAMPIGNQMERLDRKEEETLASLDKAEIQKAKKKALAYYKETYMEVILMEPLSYDGTELKFEVGVKIDGKILNPNRTITLQESKGDWVVVNQGY